MKKIKSIVVLNLVLIRTLIDLAEKHNVNLSTSIMQLSAKDKDGKEVVSREHDMRTVIDTVIEGLTQFIDQRDKDQIVDVPCELSHADAVKISDDPEFHELYQNILTNQDTSEDAAVILIQLVHKLIVKQQDDMSQSAA